MTRRRRRRRLVTKVSSAATLWSLIASSVVLASLMVANADKDPATDWGCAAAAAEYQHLGDADSVPRTLVEGESQPPNSLTACGLFKSELMHIGPTVRHPVLNVRSCLGLAYVIFRYTQVCYGVN